MKKELISIVFATSTFVLAGCSVLREAAQPPGINPDRPYMQNDNQSGRKQKQYLQFVDPEQARNIYTQDNFRFS